ncbi:MAG: hypothetical protein K2X27_07020 [Candidatus Obscuribacterales bacterium]|nr:hypothetical protein [Candidatus Obscuribacterales bacterium]
MGSIPGWLPILLERLNWGCTSSPWFGDLADEQKALARGRQIVIDMWPFIRELPLNIRAVREKIPSSMTAATQLLNRLADDESHYQKLFKQQFDLPRLTVEEIEAVETDPRTLRLCQQMSRCCREGSYVQGIHAIVVAELAATMYCRAALPLWEAYFERHSDEYEPGLINDGLEWVRLHAKTHTRHAIWMKRMLNDIEESNSTEIPPAAMEILDCMLSLWDCPQRSPVSY